MRLVAGDLTKENNFDLLHAALNCLETYHSRGNRVPREVFEYIQNEMTNITQMREKADRISKRITEKDIIEEMYGEDPRDRIEEE